MTPIQKPATAFGPPVAASGAHNAPGMNSTDNVFELSPTVTSETSTLTCAKSECQRSIILKVETLFNSIFAEFIEECE
jgi:hypothetical protein